MDKVVDDCEPFIITREQKENVVLISLDEYNSMNETLYLQSNEANARHLNNSMAQYKAGKVKLMELCEND
jgi:antitoxin YefM